MTFGSSLERSRRPLLSRFNHRLAQGGFRRLLPLIKPVIERAPHDARIGLLRVADGAGFVNFFPAQANVCGSCGFNVPIRNLEISSAAVTRDLPPLLGGIIFVCEAALCRRLDFQRVGLRAVRLGDRLNSVSSGCNYFVCI